MLDLGDEFGHRAPQGRPVICHEHGTTLSGRGRWNRLARAGTGSQDPRPAGEAAAPELSVFLT
jgi:hypothetical protein